jgi:hypothetical protein
MGKAKYLSAFEPGMVVGDRRTGLFQELQCCVVFPTQQFPVSIKNGREVKETHTWLAEWNTKTIKESRTLGAQM